MLGIRDSVISDLVMSDWLIWTLWKKSSSTNGQAIKRGGGKGRAIKEK